MDARTLGKIGLNEADMMYESLEPDEKILFRNRTEFRRLFSVSLRYGVILREIRKQIILLKKEELNRERKVRGI